MSKTLKTILIIVGIIIVAGIILMFLRGSEDTWICQGGQWVKHGNPSAEKPTTGCGAITSTTTTSQNSVDLQRKIDELYADLHEVDSGIRAKANFSDLQLIYTDEGISSLPSNILPFRYYYSPSTDLTMAICNINRTIFICKGKLDHLLSKDDFSNCKITPVLLESDTRLK